MAAPAWAERVQGRREAPGGLAAELAVRLHVAQAVATVRRSMHNSTARAEMDQSLGVIDISGAPAESCGGTREKSCN